MVQVLRLSAGERVVFLDNSDREYAAELTLLSREAVEARVMGRSLAKAEPVVRIHLFQGLLKADRFEFVLQRGLS